MITIVDEHRRGIALGAAGYLTKPIDRERLHRLVTRFRAAVPPTCVLLVEDDAFQRERMRGWLEGPQWTVREAENGGEPLKRTQEGKRAVILIEKSSCPWPKTPLSSSSMTMRTIDTRCNCCSRAMVTSGSPALPAGPRPWRLSRGKVSTSCCSI